MVDFSTDPTAEAQILRDRFTANDQEHFLESARELLKNPDEFRQVQALMQPGKQGSLPGVELVGGESADLTPTGSAKPVPAHITANFPNRCISVGSPQPKK
jgi:hypothetical protein